MTIEVEILDSEFETLLQSKAGAVQQRRHDPRRFVQLGQDGAHFVDAQHHRDVGRAVRMRHVIDGARVDTKNLTIENQ
jgi:hypothetical protein